MIPRYTGFFIVFTAAILLGAEHSPSLHAKKMFSLDSTNTQSIPLNQTFSCREIVTQKTVTLDRIDPIYGAAISGTVNLFNDAGLVRVILVDAMGNEYLLYETYSLLEDTYTFSIHNASYETKLLNAVKPASVRFELVDASINCNTFSYVTSSDYSFDQVYTNQLQVARQQHDQRIEHLNMQIKKKGMNWIAGETAISMKSYTEKKIIFANDENILPNLQGFEYYAGGVFEHKSNNPQDYVERVLNTSSAVVDSFNWCTRHGATDAKSPYYDGDKLASGWSSPLKNQGSCGSCWAHSTLAAAEMLCNLYYNKHIDLDLSEQQVMECSDACSAGKGCGGGMPGKATSWVSKNGVIEEASFKYVAKDDPTCKDSTAAPKEHLYFKGALTAKPTTEDDLKKFLIKNGPLNVGIKSMSHAMCLVGFKKDASGKLAWIFKNSYGTKSGTNGFTSVVKPLSDFGSSAFELPPKSKLYSDDSIRCADYDRDGYYNWGVGPKAATCPGEASAEGDCDDSRADLGPMAEDGSCKKIVTGLIMHTVKNSSVSFNYRNNPFNRSIHISLFTSAQSKVGMVVYDLSGSVVKTFPNLYTTNGTVQINWNRTNDQGRQISTGTYICKVVIDTETFGSKALNSFKLTVMN